MIKQSDLALAAWQSTERLLDAVVTINKTDYKTTDLTSIDYDSGGFTGDTFSVGSNYENSVSIKFSHLVEGLKAGMTLVPKVGIKTTSGYEYSSLGVFVISDEIQMDRNNDETTIKAYDQMCLMEGTYTSKLSYPARAVDVIAEIANMAGVALNTDDISRLPVLANVHSAIKGQTYRNAIGMMAQFYAGFTTFDRAGKLTIRVVTEPDYVLDPSQYEQGGLTKNEAPYKIGGIQCEVTTSTTDSSGSTSETTTTLQVGATSGSQVKLANNLMTMDRLQDIWTQIKDITFYPFSLTWFGNPAIEAGDWLTLQDTKGNKFNVPNNGYTMTFDGSLSAVSKADQTATSSSSYAWRGPLSQYVAALGGRQGASGNYIYGADITDPPLNAKFNDLWYKQNGNKTEMWTYERQSDGTGKWVLTVSDLTGTEVAAKVAEAGKDAKTAVASAETAVATANANAVKVNDTNVLSNNALTTAIDAQTKANVAVTAANSTAASFGKVEQTAASALANALSAQSDAGSAVKSATSAAADSKDAKEIAGAVSQSYKTLTDGSTMTVAELENGLATKLTKTDLGGYATQTWTQNQIKVTADGINATLSSVKSTVDGQTTSINSLTADASGFKTQISGLQVTNGKNTTDIATLQGTSKTLTSNLQSLTTDNQTNKNSINNLQQTATSLNSTIMTVQTTVQNSAVGTNLLLYAGTFENQWDFSGAGYSSVLDSGSHDYYIHYGAGVHMTWDDVVMRQSVQLEPSTYYTASFYARGSGGSLLFYLYPNVSDKVPTDNKTSIVLAASFKKYVVTFKTPANLLGAKTFIIRNDSGLNNTEVHAEIWHPKLEKGTVATDFSTNSTDNATVTALTAVSQTVDGMKLDIAKKIEQSDLAGYATQTWTSNQINVTAGTINAELAKVTTTVNGHTTSINSLTADASGFKTQIASLQVTNGKQTTDIATLQGTSKTLTSNIQTLTTDNQTNKTSISNLQQTATTLNSTLMTVQTTVQNSAVGTNLLRNTLDYGGWSAWIGEHSAVDKTIVRDNSATKLIQITGLQFDGKFSAGMAGGGPTYLTTGQTYTISIYAKAFANDYRPYNIQLAMYGDYTSQNTGGVGLNLTNTMSPDWATYKMSFVAKSGGPFNNWRVLAKALDAESVTGLIAIYIGQIKLEVGKTATLYGPNPADGATVTALTAVSQTVSSLSTTVQGKVDNAVYQTKVTQLSNQITSVVGQVNSMGQKNLVENSQFQYSYLDGASWTTNDKSVWYLSAYEWSWWNGFQGVCTNITPTTDSTKWNSILSKKVKIVDPATSYSASAVVNVGTVGIGVQLVIDFYDSNYSRISYKGQGVSVKGKQTLVKVENVVPPSGAVYVAWHFDVHGGGHIAVMAPMLVQGSTVGAFSPDSATSSEITQLQGDINLRVTKNGVVNAVNVSTEGIQIYGNKLHITAATYIDNAIIKSAMIDTITADKITAGTLNGNNVNVINLNASNIATGTLNASSVNVINLSASKITTGTLNGSTVNVINLNASNIVAGTLNGNNVNVINLSASHITTGTLTGTNLQINLDTGIVTFQSGRIHNSTNTIDINIDSGYMSVANAKTRVMLKNGEMQFVEPQIFDTETTPYLKISNDGNGAGWSGASFVGRDYAVLSNSANRGNALSGGRSYGIEKFSGISTGKDNSGWVPTTIGGSNRGVVVAGGGLTTINGAGADTSPYIAIGASDTIGVNYGGNRIVLWADYTHLPGSYKKTTSASPNLYISADGAIVRSTSASKYKTNIVREFSTDYGEKLINLPTATWMDKASLERYNEDSTQPVPGLNYGMIAEDLAAAGVEKLVVRNENGGLEGIQYDRIAVALLPLIKNMKQRIEELEEKLGA